jgi:tetratricopeptide (TPR) repeat protein
MEKGARAQLNQDYEEAEAAYAAALREAENLGVGERCLCFQMIYINLCNQGKYSQMESLCRQWIARDPCPPAYQFLSMALDRQGHSQDAKLVRKDHPLLTSEEYKLAQSWMKSSVQGNVKKHWKPPRRTDSLTSSIDFCLTKEAADPPAFVLLSCGSRKADTAALRAIAECSFTLPESMQKPVLIEFAFDYNVYPSVNHSTARRSDLNLQRKYANLKQLLEWQEKQLGVDHIEVATTLQSAAEVLGDMGNKEVALKAYQRAFELWNKSGIATVDTLFCCNSLARMLAAKKDYAGAETALRRGLDIAGNFYPSSSGNLTEIRKELAKVLAKLHKKDEAATLLKDFRRQ